jgi:hypothetical protein
LLVPLADIADDDVVVVVDDAVALEEVELDVDVVVVLEDDDDDDDVVEPVQFTLLQNNISILSSRQLLLQSTKEQGWHSIHLVCKTSKKKIKIFTLFILNPFK